MKIVIVCIFLIAVICASIYAVLLAINMVFASKELFKFLKWLDRVYPNGLFFRRPLGNDMKIINEKENV